MSYQVVIDKWKELDSLLSEMQLKDSSTPGLRREIQVAHILGHSVHKTKHGPDAYGSDGEKYEYLCAEIGRSVQMDRIDLSNVNTRIGKNHKIYAAFFRNCCVARVYEIEVQSFLDSAIQKVTRGMTRASSKGKTWTSKHLGWTEDEIVKLNSKKVYEEV